MLIRVERHAPAPGAAPAAPVQLLEIVSPRTNAASYAALEHFFAALARLEAPLGAAYPQARLRPAPADPARRQSGEQVASFTLQLQEPEYLPLHIPREAEIAANRAPQADPLLGVLAAVGAVCRRAGPHAQGLHCVRKVLKHRQQLADSPSARVDPTLDWWRTGAIGRCAGRTPEVLFGQVHEDATVELAALAAAPPPGRVLCIASGGETAFSLLAADPERLHVVDINPAQVALVALKRAAIERLSRADLLRCLDEDARAYFPSLRPHLDAATRDFWDGRQATLRHGLNHCGWADCRLRTARLLFRMLVHRRPIIEAMLRLADLDAQHRFYREHWRNRAWRPVFATAFSPPILGLLYRRGVVGAVLPAFGSLMERRVEHAFTHSATRDNGYLWQALLGRYPPDSELGLPPYLRPMLLPKVQAAVSGLQLECAEVAAWLERRPPRSLELVALSNVTELTSAAYVARLGQAAARAASAGALVVVRSIFPPPGVAADPLAARLEYDAALSQRLAHLDRSLVCSFIRVFRVPT